MRTLEEQAIAMQQMTIAILETIEAHGGPQNAETMIGSLGAVIGAVADATGRPTECLSLLVDIAKGVINGTILPELKMRKGTSI